MTPGDTAQNAITDPDDDSDVDQPMFDALRTRLNLTIETPATKPIELVARHLSKVWKIVDRRRNETMLNVKLSVPVRDGLTAEARVQFWLNGMAGGLAIRADDQMNGHAILRQRYGIDGNMTGAGRAINFALPSAEYTIDDLELQFDGFEAVMLSIRDELILPLPNAVVRDSSVKVMAAEVCLDIPCDNPQAALRRDRLVPQAGTKSVTHTIFAESSESGRKLANKERTRTNGLELIAYEKWLQHLRFELKATTTIAVRELCPPHLFAGAPLTSDGIFELLTTIYNAAGEFCCSRKDHFLRAVASQKTIFDLIVALQPLFRVAMREASAGGYRPREEAAQAAQKLLVDLLTSGLTHAVGLPKGTQVRQVLEGLAVPGGPLARKDQTTVFSISPDYAYAVPSAGDQI